jgi:hypothetical protein
LGGVILGESVRAESIVVWCKDGNSGLLVDSNCAVGTVQGVDKLVKTSLESSAVNIARRNQDLKSLYTISYPTFNLKLKSETKICE